MLHTFLYLFAYLKQLLLSPSQQSCGVRWSIKIWSGTNKSGLAEIIYRLINQFTCPCTNKRHLLGFHGASEFEHWVCVFVCVCVCVCVHVCVNLQVLHMQCTNARVHKVNENRFQIHSFGWQEDGIMDYFCLDGWTPLTNVSNIFWLSTCLVASRHTVSPVLGTLASPSLAVLYVSEVLKLAPPNFHSALAAEIGALD